MLIPQELQLSHFFRYNMSTTNKRKILSFIFLLFILVYFHITEQVYTPH